MKEFLAFDLYGPLMAWGDVAVGEHRPTASHPSKSAILGLVAGALGIRRDEDDRIQELGRSLLLGIRVNQSGELLRDYHTVQVPPERKGRSHATRRDEIRSRNLYTILSSRDYRMEGCYSVAVWNDGPAAYSLEDLRSALKSPRFVPYLGRKSCPLGLPLDPKIVEAPTLRAAFQQYQNVKQWIPVELDNVDYYWESLSEVEAGMAPTMTLRRRDSPVSRTHWQFKEREEYYHRSSGGHGELL